jgi:hypothetical protein
MIETRGSLHRSPLSHHERLAVTSCIQWTCSTVMFFSEYYSMLREYNFYYVDMTQYGSTCFQAHMRIDNSIVQPIMVSLEMK